MGPREDAFEKEYIKKVGISHAVGVPARVMKRHDDQSD